jgi:hypothetical protein
LKFLLVDPLYSRVKCNHPPVTALHKNIIVVGLEGMREPYGLDLELLGEGEGEGEGGRQRLPFTHL